MKIQRYSTINTATIEIEIIFDFYTRLPHIPGAHNDVDKLLHIRTNTDNSSQVAGIVHFLNASTAAYMYIPGWTRYQGESSR